MIGLAFSLLGLMVRLMVSVLLLLVRVIMPLSFRIVPHFFRFSIRLLPSAARVIRLMIVAVATLCVVTIRFSVTVGAALIHALAPHGAATYRRVSAARRARVSHAAIAQPDRPEVVALPAQRRQSEAEYSAVAHAGWTLEAAAELQRRLAVDRPVQAQVIAAQVRTGGFCAREKVYALGRYNEERSLNGFTKPIGRIMRDMQSEGLIPTDAIHPMQPVYDKYGSSKASGFGMPQTLADVFAASESMSG